MSKIIVYEHSNFRGLSKEFTSSVSNLFDENFNDCISSLKVIGAPWVAYTDTYFTGQPNVFEEGDYPSVEDNDSFSSLEMVTEDLTDPQITLYEHGGYGGRSLVVKNKTNLCYGSFNDRASSHKVQRGVWILSEHGERSGAQMVARASHDVYWYGAFNDCLSFLSPLKPGRPSITAELLLDRKKERVKSVIFDTLSAVNNGENEQRFSTDLDREYEGSITESFFFSDTTQVSYGAKFGVNFGSWSTETYFSESNTFTVEKGGSNTRTKRKRVRVSLPSTVRPHTKLTVKVVRKEVDVKVPVKLIISNGSHCKEEFGEYRCQSGISIFLEYDEEKI